MYMTAVLLPAIYSGCLTFFSIANRLAAKNLLHTHLSVFVPVFVEWDGRSRAVESKVKHVLNFGRFCHIAKDLP